MVKSKINYTMIMTNNEMLIHNTNNICCKIIKMFIKKTILDKPIPKPNNNNPISDENN